MRKGVLYYSENVITTNESIFFTEEWRLLTIILKIFHILHSSW